MIISNDIIWLHLPKTGGTTLNSVFRNIGKFEVDSDSEKDEYGIRIKHDSIERRESMSSWKYSNQKKFITCRRLPDWILSDFFFKKDVLRIDSDFNLCKNGMVTYSIRHGGQIKFADWWIEYFNLKDVTSLRLEYLSEDVNSKIVPYISNLNHINIGVKENKSLRDKKILNYFSLDDIKILYQNNPLWQTWEKLTYGNTYLEII
jgi:hypothetical protein